MTQDEANKIVAVIRTADSGCRTCVRSLCARLTEANLGFKFEMTDNRVEERVKSNWSDNPEDDEVYWWPEVLVSEFIQR